MVDHPLDTNVIVRYLVENPATIAHRFKGVIRFFEKIEQGQLRVVLPDLVLFQSYFVLTSYYEVPGREAAEKLGRLIAFRGIRMDSKHLMLNCLKRLEKEEIDLVDSWLLAMCDEHKIDSIYSYDTDLRKRGLKLLPIG